MGVEAHRKVEMLARREVWRTRAVGRDARALSARRAANHNMIVFTMESTIALAMQETQRQRLSFVKKKLVNTY
jgi:hypothetical protein